MAATVASSALVVVVRTRKPASPSAFVVWIIASGSPASANASRICSMVTSPVPWNATEVPPTNSMPKLSPRMPVTTKHTTIAQAAIVRKIFRRPRKLMSCLMKRPLILRAAETATLRDSSSSSVSAALIWAPSSAFSTVVPSAAASSL